MLFMVWDKSGEPFEVRPDQAKKLVIQQGWSMEAPTVATSVHDAAVKAAQEAAAAVMHEPVTVTVAETTHA